MNTADNEREAIEAAAAEWLARRDRKFTAEEAVAFARWRRADPRHAAAADELAQVWGALDDLLVKTGQHRAGGVAATSPARVQPALAAVPERRRTVRVRWWPVLAMAAAVIVAVGAALWRKPQVVVESSIRYETAIGAQQRFTLPDGSVVMLNTHSAIGLAFSSHERRVVLERGEAHFWVKKDPTRPFAVIAGRAEARALGTAFSVRLHERETEVIVTEGRVKFGTSEAEATASAAELRAGERARLALTGQFAPRVESLDAKTIQRLTAWQTGWIEFSNTPLHEAVAEFNRYHSQRIELGDASIRLLPIGGRFAIDNREGFLRSLDTLFEVTVTSRDREKVMLGLRR